MKSLFCACLAVIVTACNNESGFTSSQNQQPDSGIYFAYSPIYSNLRAGNYQYAKTVTDIWKEYENGDITKTAGYFAKDVTFIFPDQVLKGPRDSVLKVLKKKRDRLGSVQSFIYSWLPAYATDHDEHWVFLWGRQENTDSTGKYHLIELHESWLFDKEGKITMVRQYHTGG